VPPLIGILFFLLVIAALCIVTYLLSRRYVVARSRRAEEVGRESDVSGVYPGSVGMPPYHGGRDPSPRDRLRRPETDERD
jgi:hypothetical protein